MSNRNNTYVNPNYKPANKYVRPTTALVPRPLPETLPQPIPPTTQVKDVVLNGIAFESSGRSLVRKDREFLLCALSSKFRGHPPLVTTPTFLVPKPVSTGPRPNPPNQEFIRKSGHLIPSSRIYKPKPSRGRRGRPTNRNMTLDNTRKPYQSVMQQDLSYLQSDYVHRRRTSTKRPKYSDKPCPRFTTTGAPKSASRRFDPHHLLNPLLFSVHTCLPLLPLLFLQVPVVVASLAFINTILPRLPSAGTSYKAAVRILSIPVTFRTIPHRSVRRCVCTS